MNPMPELSIVMPCLNEAQTLPLCIAKAKAFLSSHGIEGEIVIGDNGSSDGSQELARALGARVVEVPRRGYGAALHGAVSAARGRYCIMGDSDDSYDFSKLAPFLQALRGGADLVMGNRFAGGISPVAMPWKNRYLGNPVLSGLGRFLFRTPIKDFHCGLRGFSRDAFLRMDLRTIGMEFASEVVIKAALLGMRIEEVPTTLEKDGRARPPHLRPWRDGWRHLRFMLLFSPAWLFLYPGLGLALLELGLGGALMTGPLRIAGVRLDLGALLYCVTMVELGAQAVIFAWLARAYTIQEGLLPASLRMRRLEPLVTLENGLVLGLGLLGLGLGLLGWAIAIWSQAGFGNLDVGRIARIVLGSSLALSLGMEVLLSSFLLSTLRLHIRET